MDASEAAIITRSYYDIEKDLDKLYAAIRCRAERGQNKIVWTTTNALVKKHLINKGYQVESILSYDILGKYMMKIMW